MLLRCLLLGVVGIGPLLVSPSHAQSFAPVVAYPVGAGNGPCSVAAGDINNDEYPDVVTANLDSHTVSVLLNKQNGTFAPAATYVVGSAAYLQAVALADVNGDGYLDIVAAAGPGALAAVLLNNRNSTFSPAVLYGAGASNYAESVAVADVNGDAKPDILTANGSATGTASVLLGRPAGAFEEPVAYAAGTYPFGIVAGDVNADGYADLAVADYFDKAQVLINQKNGSFAPAVGYPAGAGGQPVGIALGDVNNDGYPDLTTANFTGTVGVLLNKQNGTFWPALTYAAGGYPRNVALGDVNGDKYLDLVTANSNTNVVGVLLNQRNGTFAPVATFPAGPGSSPRSIAVSDINQDGRPDLVVANYDANAVGVLLNSTPLASRPSLPGATVTLHPNPAGPASQLTLSLANLPAAVAEVRLTVVEATGRAVVWQRLPAHQGSALAEIATAGLAPGLYVVRLLAYDKRGELAGALLTQQLGVH